MYCNGMKPKLKISLEYDKKNNIRSVIIVAIAVAMYITIHFYVKTLIAYSIEN